ncbi:hypothetical protein ACEPPZ_04535, partial [Paracoccus yeei]|uniref:[protein-PII] uridylyltransferase family protein n=1 Tax=Paracoccus yeei TaxID=147645 RepID=UPI0037CED4A6
AGSTGSAGLVSRDEAETLARARRFLWNLQCAGRLLTDRPLDMETLGKGGQAFLLRETGTETLAALSERLAQTVEQAGQVIDQLMAKAEQAGAAP